MRVIIFSETANPRGGAERVALTSAQGLADRGHDVTLVAAYGPIDPELRGVRVEVGDRGAPPPPAQRFRAFGRIWSPTARSLVRQVLAGAPKDAILHYHCGYMLLTASAFGPVAQSGLPIVYTHHEYSWGCPLQGFYNYRTSAPCGQVGGSFGCVRTHCNEGPYIGKMVEHARHGLAFRASGFRSRVSQHVLVSEFSARILRPYLPPGVSSQVLRNPISATDLGPSEIKANAPFVYVGRMTAEKDPVLLARATAEIGAPVTFVGDGPMLEKVREANPDAQVTGWVDSAAVRSVIEQARALVMTSRWYEGQPLVVAEALAAGIPAIVPSTCAASDAIEDGASGLVFESGNQADLTRALRRMLEPGAAAAMGALGYRRYWSDPPTLDRHLDLLLEVYERAAGGST